MRMPFLAALVALVAAVIAATATAATPKPLISSANSGAGAGVVAAVPASHGHAELIIEVTSTPSKQPVQVEWTLACPGKRHGLVNTHTPFRRTLKSVKGCAVNLQGQLWVEHGKAADGTIVAVIRGA
jgi:hypothetical protein